MTWRETKACLAEDLRVNGSSGSIFQCLYTCLFNLRFQTIAFYRFVFYFNHKPGLMSLRGICLYFQQVLSGCHIHPNAVIGRRLKLPHPSGIVIGNGVRIGDDVTVFQHVTMGSHGKAHQEKKYPVVDNGVVIYAGAVIVGPVHIGERAVIGAGSVVLADVPPQTVVVGAPARAIREIRDDDIFYQE